MNNNLDFVHESRLIRNSSFRYIFPPMFGMIFSQMAPVVDGLCASGSMGEEALSAIGITGPVEYGFNIICALFGIGCGVAVSHCSGRGDKATAARVFTRTLIFLTVISIAFSAAGIIFIDPLLRLLCATPDNYSYAKEYLTIVLAGTVFLSINFAGDYILANDNNENLAVAGDITGAIVNIIIDCVGVFVFRQGVWVLAFGTVAGSVCCCLVYLLHFRKKDRLCRFVKPERKEGDPGLFEIVKPGTAEAVMYLFFAIQLIVQNFVLREDGGTSGLANSAIMENLALVFTIVIAGCTDAVYPMASAYDGEQNKSGMLMVKRSLTKTGFILLCVPVVVLCIFPQLTIIPYRITDPVMLESLPFAIRIVSITQFLIFFATFLIDYLSATGQEGKANLAFAIQFGIQIPLTFVLDKYAPMNSPWYASLISQIGVLIFLCFFCGDLTKGIRSFYRENLLTLKGGSIGPEFIKIIEEEAYKITDEKQYDTLSRLMTGPLLDVLSERTAPHGTFSILKRSDDNLAAVLHYESKKDLLQDLLEDLSEYEEPDEGDDEEDEEEKVPFDTCIRSEFLGMRRMMIILTGNGRIKKGEQ